MPQAGFAPALQRIVHISRPVLWINALGTGVVGMWLAGSLWQWEALPLLLWLTLPFNLLIYGVNDVFDQDTDALNPRKGSIEGARIRSEEVRTILAAVLVSNVPFVVWFAVALPPAALGWIALYVLVFVFYSAPPLRFKARAYVDSLSNAAYALPLVFVPYALGAAPVWPAALGLMAWSIAKHAFDAVQDIEEDRAVAITTTAVRLGPRGTALWSGGWWALSTLGFALVSLPVAAVNALIAGWLVGSLLRDPRPETGHRLYRHSIAFPYVAGAVAGVQLTVALFFGLYP
ncbi:UbiA family prenyltransferase [Kocuria sp. M1N1S27]|uniref:UbiA family prenyltransferase n=1 Tax=Kocuria kalidii TaxID=3376283 RepID=UPI0037ABD319